MSNPLSFLTGLAIGVGATVAVRDLAPAIVPHARSLTKRGIKLAVLGFDQSRERAALAAEWLSDLVAEVQTELHEERAAAPAGGELLAELLAEGQPAEPR